VTGILQLYFYKEAQVPSRRNSEVAAEISLLIYQQ